MIFCIDDNGQGEESPYASLSAFDCGINIIPWKRHALHRMHYLKTFMTHVFNTHESTASLCPRNPCDIFWTICTSCYIYLVTFVCLQVKRLISAPVQLVIFLESCHSTLLTDHFKYVSFQCFPTAILVLKQLIKKARLF